MIWIKHWNVNSTTTFSSQSFSHFQRRLFLSLTFAFPLTCSIGDLAPNFIEKIEAIWRKPPFPSTKSTNLMLLSLYPLFPFLFFFRISQYVYLRSVHSLEHWFQCPLPIHGVCFYNYPQSFLHYQFFPSP